MKKILFVLPSLIVGGLEKTQVAIANALVKRDYDVTVMTLSNGEDLKKDLDSRVHFIHKPYKPHPIMSKIPYIRHKFYDDGMWETRASAETLYKYYVGKEKFDIEVGFFRGLAIKIISGSVNRNSTKLAWVHSDFKRVTTYKNNFKCFDDVKKAYSKFDKVVCVSKQARESFIDVIGNIGNVITIYNMLPVENIVKKSNEVCDIKRERFTILSVGHLVEAKGFDRLINVVSRLKNNFDLDLWIVGSGEKEQELKTQIERLKLNNVKLLGKQENPYKYMKNADLYVCSSLFEGYNLTVAEALILGKPVLSTNCTGPTEILDNGKYGVIVDNSEDGLYNGIVMLLKDEAKINEYKNLAKLRIDFFNEEKIVNEIEELF